MSIKNMSIVELNHDDIIWSITSACSIDRQNVLKFVKLHNKSVCTNQAYVDEIISYSVDLRP